ncbi:MAG: helix-turn-helix domain-containing protein [Bacteroidia bacterium]
MAQHRGEIIEKAVRQSGISITKLAQRLGKSRRTIYNIFQDKDVPVDLIVEISRIINYNFEKEIHNFAQKGRHFYEVQTTDADYWKNKYLNLLEEHNELLKKFAKKKKN